MHLSLEVLHRLEVLQVEKFRFEDAEEIFYDSIVQTVPFTAYALLDALLRQHPLVLLMLVVIALNLITNPTTIPTAAATKQLPIYSVERNQKMVSISFDAAWGDGWLR